MFIKAHSGHFRLAFVHREELHLIQTLVAETVLGKCLYTFLIDASRSTSLIHILVLVIVTTRMKLSAHPRDVDSRFTAD